MESCAGFWSLLVPPPPPSVTAGRIHTYSSVRQASALKPQCFKYLFHDPGPNRLRRSTGSDPLRAKHRKPEETERATSPMSRPLSRTCLLRRQTLWAFPALKAAIPGTRPAFLGRRFLMHHFKKLAVRRGQLNLGFDELKMALNCQSKHWILGVSYRKFSLREFTMYFLG